MRRITILILTALLLVLLLAGCGEIPSGEELADTYMSALAAGDFTAASACTAEGVFPAAAADASTEAGLALQAAVRSGWTWERTSYTQDKKTAVVEVTVTGIDMEKACAAAPALMQETLTQTVGAANRFSDIYNSDNSYRDDVLQAAEQTVFSAVTDGSCNSEYRIQLTMAYSHKAWLITDAGSLESAISGGSPDPDAEAADLLAAEQSGVTYIPITYTIPEDATSGPVPNADNFGSTTDPSVVDALIASDTAQRLLAGRTLTWNSSIEFLPDTEIRYYLDDTILMIQWQECTAQAVGTYAEVVVADGSQFRRKLVNDTLGGWDFDVATNLAIQSNAVLASGGDLYNHARACGIVVYDREIYRFEPDTCDTCYITSSGDMLFSYRGQFTTQEEAEQFIAENDILFSLCFGPVIIENGVDVTPETYAWGEINDTYARSAIGMFGDSLHYLIMNINCQQPNYYYLATLHQATDAMMAHGCTKAYALDGGQTAEIIVNGEMINPVQFGTERNVSDIIYFATAIPSD